MRRKWPSFGMTGIVCDVAVGYVLKENDDIRRGKDWNTILNRTPRVPVSIVNLHDCLFWLLNALMTTVLSNKEPSDRVNWPPNGISI